MVDTMLNSKFGYTRLRKIGGGNQGAAYLVQDGRAKTHVMKELTVNWDDQMTVQHAMSEVGVVANLSPHPNILPLMESFISFDKRHHTLHLISEYCPHGDLDARIASQAKLGGFFPEDQVLDWLAQLFSAVRHLHDRNILHRDIKGANIFMAVDDSLRLGDFGLSFPTVSGGGAREMTMLGTPYYASPELLMKAGYAAPNDIWGLGVVAYDLMALRKPFDAKSMPRLLQLIVHGVPDSLPSIYSTDLQYMVFAMLNKEPASRPDIRTILEHPLFFSRFQAIEGRRVPSPLPPRTCSCYLSATHCTCGNEDERGPGGAFPALCKRFQELRARKSPHPPISPTSPTPPAVATPPDVSGLGTPTPNASGSGAFVPTAPVISSDDFKSRSGLFLRGLQELLERYGTECDLQAMRENMEHEIEALRSSCETLAVSHAGDAPLDKPLAYSQKLDLLLPPGFQLLRPPTSAEAAAAEEAGVAAGEVSVAVPDVAPT